MNARVRVDVPQSHKQMLQIDLKHHVLFDGSLQIVKTTNDVPIPDDEPLILFRGRDYLALPLLRHYRKMCAADGVTEYQLESIDKIIRRFQEFADENPDVMKQPGITRGK